ncbi:MAG: nitroreductase family deazaflavin-dependent oxidoreductase [Chloroflexota bacterium]|nr:MAG: nitroreductase family deazaflavin-dependent oxidoreductase [Chloroflexota bacterium]
MALPTAAYRLIGRLSTSRFDRRLHPLLYRLTGGRGIVGRVLGCEMVLLTTTGRASGKSRSVTLFAFPVDGGSVPGSWAVIGSRGGSKIIPGWYRNLVASPRATVQHRDRSFAARAREVSGEEYEGIFERAAHAYPGYRLYRAESPVHVPIVVLEPVGQSSVP